MKKWISKFLAVSALSILTAFTSMSCSSGGSDNTAMLFLTQPEKTSEQKKDNPVTHSSVTNITALPGNTKVSLSWTNPAASTFNGVNLYYGTTNQPSIFKVNIPASSNSYEFTGLTNGTTYYFKLVALYTDTQDLFPSIVASATPTSTPAPVTHNGITTLTATPGTASVSLSWTNPTDSTFSGNKLYYGTTNQPATLKEALTTSATTYTFTGLTNGTKYYFKLVSTFTDTSTTYDSNVADATPSAPSGLTSKQFASAMTIGWNLGNTLDAHDTGTGKTNKGLTTENSWGMPETTKEMIDAIAAKGFKTIRIPVSWHNHITADNGNYPIDSTWMARVKTIVDWAVANNMYIILNVHHDDLKKAEMSTMYGYCVDLDTSYQTTSKAYLSKVWTQIATTFASYSDKLVFEVLNEPRYRDGANNGFDTPSNLSDYNAVIKSYEETCISAIRAVSGNENRFIMVPYYAANPYSSEGWSVPTDTATDKLLISTHAYSPYGFAMYDGTNHTTFTTTGTNNDESSLVDLFNTLNTKWISQGRGVVMGEASATDKQNDAERLKWINSYFAKAKAKGIPVVLWDNMKTYSETGDKGEFHGWYNRNSNTFFFPELVNAMITKAGETPGSDPTPTGNATVWSGEQDLGHWDGENHKITIENTNFSAATSSSYLKFTISKGAECNATLTAAEGGGPCTNNYSIIQVITSWTNGNVPGSTDTSGVTISNDQIKVTSIIPATGTTTVNFTPSTWDTIKTKGIIIYGHKVLITKVELVTP